jgi:Ca2+-binding RTX toxin-like protein
LLLTNYVVLDFTPDVITNEHVVGKFADVFAPGAVNNSNRFLDYNGDNTIGEADAKLAIGKIASRVNRLLKPFRDDPNISLVVMHTPDLHNSSDPGAGERKLAQGHASSTDNAYVVYVGDTRPTATAPEYGMAQQAFAGENNEFYAYAFAGGIKGLLASGNYGWKPQAKLTSVDFTNNVAFAIAHELGHLWGLGHLVDVDSSPANPLKPDNYHHVMNTPTYANPATARFRDDAVHKMEIGNAATGAISLQQVNAKQEVQNSLRTSAGGAFVQTTVPNATFPTIPTYKQSLGAAADASPNNPPPAASTTVPAATSGTAAGKTISSIATSLTTGFNSLRQDYFDDFASRLNLPAGALPLMNTDLGTLLGAESALLSAVGSINVSSATTMTQLQQQLTTAGFTIDAALSDAQFAALDPSKPADFVRASHTYSLAQIQKTAALDPQALGTIGDLAGINISGQLDVLANVYFTISFGVDTGGFYLAPGNGVLGSIAVGGNLTASAGGGTIKGNAAIGLSPQIRLKTTNSDGRVRLADLSANPPTSFVNATDRTLVGGAGVNLEFSYTVGSARTVQFGGDWVWDLKPDATGFTLDTTNSGLDADGFFDSITQAVIDGIDDLRSKIDGGINSALNTNLPFFNNELVARLRAPVTGELDLEAEFGSTRAALAEYGFQVITTANVSTFLQNQVAGTPSTSDLLQVRLQKQAATNLQFNITDLTNFFDAALPAPFNLDQIFGNNVVFTTSLTAGLDLTLAVSSAGEIVIVDRGQSQPDEFQVDATIGIFIDRIGGSIGPFEAGVDDGTGNLSVSLDFDLVAPSNPTAGGRIPLASFANIGSVSQASVAATTSLELPIALRIGQGGPGVLTRYSVFGETQSPITFKFGPNKSSDPKQGFGPLSFELGDFVKDLVGPVIHKINQVAPIPERLVDFLTSPLPVVNKSPLDVLRTVLQSQGKQDELEALDYIALLFDIAKLSKRVDKLSSSGGSLDLSGFGLGTKPANTGQGSETGGETGFFDDLKDDLAEYYVTLPFLENTGSKVISLIFDPTTEIDLIRWDPPKMDVSTGRYQLLSVPLVSYGIPLVAEVRGSFIVSINFGLFAEIALGFTTRGITQTGKLLDGLYFDDQGEDPTREFGGYIDVSAGVEGGAFVFNKKIAALYGEGGLHVEIGADIEDWNSAEEVVYAEAPDYRVYRDEFDAIIDDPSLGFSCLFTLSGEMTPFVEIGYEVTDDKLKAFAKLYGVPTEDSERVDLPGFNWTRDSCPKTEPVKLADAVGDSLVMRPIDPSKPGQRVDVRFRKDNSGNPLKLRLQLQDQTTNPKFMFQEFDIDDQGRILAETVSGQLVPVDRLELVGTELADSVTMDPLVARYFRTYTIDTYGEDDRVYLGDFSELNLQQLKLTSTVIRTGAGNDRVQATPFADTVFSGSGNDVVYTYGGADTLDAGDGDDFVYGGAGADNILGGPGNDHLFGEEDDDVIDGGIGNDTLHGGSGNDMLLGGSGDDKIYGGEDNDEIHAGEGNDIALGNDGDDVIYGDGGDDFLFGDNSLYPNNVGGLAEPDCLATNLSITTQIEFGIFCPESSRLVEIWYVTETPPGGRDTIYGGDGDDWIEGGIDDDTLHGEAGNDRIYGSSLYHAVRANGNAFGNDTVYGGDGYDIIGTSVGNDTVHGGVGDDTITTGDGDDVVYGGTGKDVIRGGRGADNLRGDDDDDDIEGGADNDVIFGGTGADKLKGDEGDDQIFGGDGDDVIFGGVGNDLIEGGKGFDQIEGDADNDRLFGHSESGTGDDNSPDRILGGDGDDYIEGNGGADELRGGYGNDIIYGHSLSGAADDGADDMIFGDFDNDRLYGQLGNDEIRGGAGNDRIWGAAGDDRMFGDDGNDVIVGDVGNDWIEGGDHDDVIYAGAGNDQVFGDAGSDLIYAGLGNDIISGGAGNDWLFGEEGDDQIFGNDGDDYLDGSDGVDNLYGGRGNDYLMAGSGFGGELHGNEGDDIIIGSDDGSPTDPNFFDTTYFGDRIFGGPGNDQIWGLGGADYIDAGDGDDRVDSGTGSDYVLGGLGNDWLYAGLDLGDVIYGGAGDDEIYGSHVGDDLLYGEDGNDRIFGQGGNDRLEGGSGHDYLDGGTGTDVVLGGDGDDELRGGGGVGDQLFGEVGDDRIYGSNDGADIIRGGTGQDIVFGGGGNDQIFGDEGDDVLYGEDGDDAIEGGPGSDVLLGGAGHDTLYGHSASGAGDDNAVDYIYGDFGTNANEVGSGRDQLFGGGGNDLLFGEGDDDLINTGAGTSDIVNYGSGEGANPADFTPPTPTTPPAIVPGTAKIVAMASLPTGVDGRGRWAELAGSASGLGLSGDANISYEPSVAASSTAQYVAWSDGQQGNLEIYVAKHDTGGWTQLAGSAERGGVSQTTTSSRQSSITVDASGNPVVAWTEIMPTGSDIHVMAWSPTANGGAGGWIALGNSRSAGGISSSGSASRPLIVNTASGLLVAWLDKANGTANVRARRFDGTNWVAVGSSTTGGGISNSTTDVSQLALASDGTKVAVAWTQSVSGTRQVYLREFNGTAWAELGGSASGNGISGSARESAAATLAYHGGQLFAAWEESGTRVDTPAAEIYAARFQSGSWQAAGVGSNSGGGVSNAGGSSMRPRLAAGGNKLHLWWTDEPLARVTPGHVNVYTKHWNGSAFIEEVAGDAQATGIATLTGVPLQLNATVDSTGKPFVLWNDVNARRSEVLLRSNELRLTGTIHTATGEAGSTIQDILNNFTLGPGDAIVVSGANNGNFVVSNADAGVAILGGPGSRINGDVTIDGAANVVLQRLMVSGSITANSADLFSLRDSTTGTVLIAGGADGQVVGNQTNGITVQANATNTIVEQNKLGDLRIGTGGATNLLVRGNEFIRILLTAAASGRITANQATHLHVAAPFTGLIDANQIAKGLEGIRYEAAATLSGNRVSESVVGVVVNLANPVQGFGYVGAAVPNDIVGNMTGVRIDQGRMQGQRIRQNNVGVAGVGVLGGDTIDTANRIEANTVGADFNGTIQFNRFISNETNIRARNGQLIARNLIYGQMMVGVQTAGATDVRIFDNSFHAVSGDNIRIEQSSREVEVRGNILWSEVGYNIFVGTNSQPGFFSDYNSLYTGPTGKLVSYNNLEFRDILDWQVDVNRFDLNSIGRTVVNPNSAKPQFVNPYHGDFRVFANAAALRRTSLTPDANDSRVDQHVQHSFPNLLTNPGFENSLTGWQTNPQSSTQSTAPAAFEGTKYFASGDVAVGEAKQTVNLVAAGHSSAALDSDNLTIVFGGRVRSAAESQADRGQIRLIFLDGSGASLGSALAAPVEVPDRWHLSGQRVRIPLGTRSVRFEFTATRLSDSGNDAYLDHAFVRVLPESFAPDLGAYSSTAQDIAGPPQPRMALRSPDLYVDWERDKPHEIRWESFPNPTNAAVKIDLYQDGPHGPALVTTIAAGTPDDGSFIWTPANSNVAYGTLGLRIQVSLVDSPWIVDRSSETFAVPENTATFFVNDGATQNDEYVTAVGSNRNTGKTAATPKPNPVNVLRTYTLGPTHTLFVDNGIYDLHSPIVLSGGGIRGDDEGFTITGPTNPARNTTLRYAHPSITGPMIELDDADTMTIRNLTLLGGSLGMLVANDSTNLVASDLVIRNQQSDGVRIEGGSTGATLDRLQVISNAGHGIFADNQISRIAGSLIVGNRGDGIHLLQPRSVVIEGNTIRNSAESGIELYDPTGSTSRIGSNDLTLARGNTVEFNAEHGIDVSGPVLVAGNVVVGHLGSHFAGIRSVDATVTRNVVRDNNVGIYNVGFDNVVTENRAYGNTVGIRNEGNRNKLARNVVYSNTSGIEVGTTWSTRFDGSVQNNLVYGNSSTGVLLLGVQPGTTFRNNTVYQPAGMALRIDGGSQGVTVRDNILWTNSGVAVDVAADSQFGFNSDFNLIVAAGTGVVGRWQNSSRPTLAAWRSASNGDANSLSQDPLFVNPVGADGILGASTASDGRDDDFHLRSQSGSFHGGSLAPVISMTTGLPTFTMSTVVSDAATSPAIDRGDVASSFANEPTPNGGFVNLGAYGNTEQASKSLAQYITLINPSGGESWPMQRDVTIRWRSHNTLGTVKIELLEPASPTVVHSIATSTPNNGSLTWTVPESIAAGIYRVRISRNDVAISFTSSTIEIKEPVSAYYVNIPSDSDLSDNQYTTAAGDFVNDGLSPATPLDSIQALLASGIVFKPGDVILVDHGVYDSTTNIVLTAALAGVTIQGPTDVGKSAVIDRGNTSAGSYGFELIDADNITISHVGITGGQIGIFADSGSDSDNITVRDNDVFGNYDAGIHLGFDTGAANLNDAARILNNRVHDNNAATYANGIVARGPRTIVSGNTVYGEQVGIDARYIFGFYEVAPREDWIQIKDNTIFSNATGIDIQDNVLVEGNSVYGHSAGYGISTFDGGIIRSNQAYDNAVGIKLLGNKAIAESNRVYRNTIGILADDQTQVLANRVYSNVIGIETGEDIFSDNFAGRLTNNVVYANQQIGINVQGAQPGNVIEHNTIYEPTANAIQVGGNSNSLKLRNNIISVAAGRGLVVANDSQQAFASDWNLFQITGAGKAGAFNDQEYVSLAAWSAALGFDRNSLTGDPQFLDLLGGDGHLGFVPQTNASPRIINDQDAAFSATGTWSNLVGTIGTFLEGNGTATWSRTINVMMDETYAISASAIWPSHNALSSNGYIELQTGLGGDNASIDLSQTTGASLSAGGTATSDGEIQISLNLTGFPAIAEVGGIGVNGPASLSPPQSLFGDFRNDSFGKNYHRNTGEAHNDLGHWTGTPFRTNDVAQFEINNIVPGNWYQLSTTWDPRDYNSSQTRIEIWSGDQLVGMRRVDQRLAPDDFSDANQSWERLGYFRAAADKFYVRLIGEVEPSVVADAVHVLPMGGTGGTDDDLRLRASSPAIDRADPASYYFAEPYPNGDRANIGAQGNTTDATTSAVQLVQVLTPNGGERLEVDSILPILWRTQGLTAGRPVLRMNVGGNSVGPWLQEAYSTTGFDGASTIVETIDTSGVPHFAPIDVYQQYRESEHLGYRFAVPDGAYNVRLHLMEPWIESIGQRVFDVFGQNQLVGDDIDPFALAGANHKAIALDYTLVATGGQGLNVDLRRVGESWSPVLSGIEVSALNPLGLANPKFTIELSRDDGATWNAIAGNQSVGRFGEGAFAWTIPQNLETDASTARLRIATTDGLMPSDDSDRGFMIVNSGSAYYVNMANDTNLSDNQYTTAAGNDANSGKSPDRPMASLAALLEAYDLDPGDIVYVDVGTYATPRNIVVRGDDAGVTIQGPTDAGKSAVIDRGNTTAGSYVLELIDADDVTISHLGITGGQIGIFADSDSDSDHVTIRDSEIFGNSDAGIHFGFETGTGNRNEAARILNNRVHDNHASSFSVGIIARGPRTIVSGNMVYGENEGISANYHYGFYETAPREDWLQVTGNTVFDNQTGIVIQNNVLVEGNTVYGHDTGYGITTFDGGIIRGNQVYNNATGINVQGQSAVAEQNRVFRNTVGILAEDQAQVLANQVFSNRVGIDTGSENQSRRFYGRVANNVVYANQQIGIHVHGTLLGNVIEHNTIYEPTANAIEVGGSSLSASLRNNIVSVGAGWAIDVQFGSEVGFDSDYNLFDLRGAAKLARWVGYEINDLSNWNHALGFDRHSLLADPLFVDVDGADNRLGFDAATGTDKSADDNFLLQTMSPAIDRAGPLAWYLREPAPNGNRANLGAYGNTPLATTSAVSVIQVLSPNGNEKLEAGSTASVSWHTAGVTARQPVALINVGGAVADYWLTDSFSTRSDTFPQQIADTIDLQGIVQPAPANVYVTYREAPSWYAGASLSYRLPVPDGAYKLRLHFVEPQYEQAGQRQFDIYLQDSLAVSQFDVYAAAGAKHKATSVEHDVNAAGGGGISIDLRNIPDKAAAILSAIELWREDAALPMSANSLLELSLDNGATWTQLASVAALDRYGRGQFDWAVGSQITGGNAARVRATSGIADVSDQPFLIANAGNAFYVNIAGDTIFSDNEYTTAAGDDRNSGKSPDRPMANLAALLRAYDLEPGDVVYVDTGNYRLLDDIRLLADDSGVLIQGPQQPPHTATLDRHNIPAAQQDPPQAGITGSVFELCGGNAVTLANLTITGGEYGVLGPDACSSQAFTLRDSRVFANGTSGVYLSSNHAGATIRGNRIHDQTISSFASAGISIFGTNVVVADNEVFGNRRGIEVASPTLDAGNRILGNLVHNNIEVGISLTAGTVASGNTVRGTRLANQTGIVLWGGEAFDNTVHGNSVGLAINSDGTVRRNRVFDNQTGIRTFNLGQIQDNIVYSNLVGILAEGPSYSASPVITSNLVYANADFGVLLKQTHQARVINNTVNQVVGDAVRLQDASAGATVLNNILSVSSGHALFVADDSQAGLVSDYNLLHLATAGSAFIGHWSGASIENLGDWQTATSQDQNSIVGDPQWIDRNGADNIFGYDPVNRIDGGRDDNFHLSKGSPAIDRGHSWNAPRFDRAGNPRVDDPGTGNQGSPDYREQDTLDTAFSPVPGGVAQGWFGDESAWSLPLPFSFPFYGVLYDTIYISTEGLIQLDGLDWPDDGANGMDGLTRNVRIAPLWDDLNTLGANDDIYVDDSQPGQITIYWDGTNSADDSDVQFAATLFDDGRIRFNYGPGNSNLSPTIGISRGDGTVVRSTYDGLASLGNRPSRLFALEPGYVDLGAFEFRGSTLDTTPPTIVSTSVVDMPTGSAIHIVFSEAIDPIDANAAANYELREAGPNGTLGDGDDVMLTLLPHYEPGGLLVVLHVTTPGANLTAGKFELTVHADSTIHDLSGLKLDGDGDGQEGGNFVAVNRPPVITPISNQSVAEGSVLTVNVQASDPDGNSLTFSLAAGAPSGATINAQTGIFRWTPTESQAPGNYTITVRVSDNGSPAMTSSASFQITATEVNDPPVIAAISDKTAEDGTELDFFVLATDPENDAITYTLGAGTPAGAAIHPTSGRFSWTPSEAQSPGTFIITVIATDNGTPNRSSSRQFTVSVLEKNDPPVIAAIASRTLLEGVEVTFQVAATDPEGGTLQFAFVGNVPAGATLNPTTGVFAWTPGELDGGKQFTFTVRATDNGTPPLSSTQPFTITVNELNSPPTVSGPTTAQVRAGDAYNAQFQATDPDVPQNGIRFSLAPNAPTGATIDPVTGLFTWTPTLAQLGSHTIAVVATDDGFPARSANHVLTIQITVAEVNQPPVLAAIGNKSVNEGSALTFTPTASDPDIPANTLSYSLDAGAPTGASINATSGVFSWTPTEAQGPGTYSVTIRVTDNGTLALSDFETIQITVAEVNDFAPVVSDNTFNLDENSQAGTVVGQVQTSDQDTPFSLRFEIIAAEPANPFTINAATGVITVNNSVLLDREEITEFTLEVRVTDDGVPAKSGTGTITVKLNDQNEYAPHGENDGYETDEDTVLEIDPPGLLANDSPGDATETLTISAFDGLSELGAHITLDTFGGFRYDPRTPALQVKGRGETLVDTFTYELQDGQGSTATALVTITIQGVNDWHNQRIPLDVNDNASIEPLDALIIINYLNENGPKRLPARVDRPEFYYDTDDDGHVAPLDVLLIINKLNTPFGGGEGEPPATGIVIPTGLGLVQPLFDGGQAIERLRLSADLRLALHPARPASSEYPLPLRAASVQASRSTRILDNLFADEESLLDALDDVLLSVLAETRR